MIAVAGIAVYLLWAELSRGIKYVLQREHLPSTVGIVLLAFIAVLRAITALR